MGFIKLAIQKGYNLTPTYIIGENQIFKTSEFGRKISMAIYNMLGIPVPLVQGRWGLPWFVPNPTPITFLIGNVIKVEKRDIVTDEYVDEL